MAIKKRFPAFSLEVIGDGKDRKWVGKYVKVQGFKNNSQKYYALHQFAFVSRYLGILEAMVQKRLVFAVADTPIKYDYLTMSPSIKWIVIAENADQLQEKVQYYVSHKKEEEELVRNAYIWSKKQTWEKLTHMYLTLWNSF